MALLLVHANRGLSREELFNDAAKRMERLQTVEQIIASKRISGIQIVQRLEAGCILFVSAPTETLLLQLQNKLKDDGIVASLSRKGIFREAAGRIA